MIQELKIYVCGGVPTDDVMFPIIALCVCVVWLLVGIREMYKASKKHGGVPLETAAGAMIFFILPSLLGIVGSLIGLITNLQHE